MRGYAAATFPMISWEQGSPICSVFESHSIIMLKSKVGSVLGTQDTSFIPSRKGTSNTGHLF